LIATGQNPADVLRVVEQPQRRTFADVAIAYQASRVDLAAETAQSLRSHLKAILPAFGARDPEQVTPADVQAWIAASALRPASVRRYLQTLRAIFDYAGVDDPNPARDPRVRLPWEDHAQVTPPSAADVEAIIAASPPRWRLALQVLAATGMRVGELHQLSWQDVDASNGRFRVRQGKTTAARRWVSVPDLLMVEILAATPPDDRTPDRRVFPGAPDVLKGVMARACKSVGIAHYHPHDLRHRYASVRIGRGVPVTLVAAQLGHSKNSLTLDVYSHVLIDE
jgi:integrase